MKSELLLSLTQGRRQPNYAREDKKRQAEVTPIKRLEISFNNPDREIVKWLSCLSWDLNSQASSIISSDNVQRLDDKSCVTVQILMHCIRAIIKSNRIPTIINILRHSSVVSL